MAESGGGFRWLKISCLGCLGVIGLGVLLAATLSGVAYLRVKAEKVADRTLSPALPQTEATGVPQEEPAATPPAGTVPADPPGPTRAPLPERPAAGGRVELHLSGGSFFVEPGEPGRPLRVEARYDENSYELTEQLDENGDDWTYRLDFRRTGSSLMTSLRQLFGGSTPEVRVYLPPDRPLLLDLNLKQGGSELELGGLWLTALDVEFGQAGLELNFDDPLREPMDSMALHGAMSGLNVTRVGNASPRELSVDYNMGGMNLDLRGAWVVDSDISITTRMSGTAVRLPDDVQILGLDDFGPRIPPELEIKPPTLTFTVSGEDIEFH